MKLSAILFLLLTSLTLHAQDLPVLKAKVTTPVLQELMGGCSLRCGFPWQVQAMVSTTGKSTPHPVYATNDDDASSAWVDENASSVGTKLVFQFPKKLPRELEETPFYGFDLADGFIKSDDLWKSHARVKRMKLYYNNKPLYIIDFSDTRRWQIVTFDDILIHQGDSMTLEILEVYPGTKSQAAAITELVLQGAH